MNAYEILCSMCNDGIMIKEHDIRLTEKIMGLSSMQRSYDANFILDFIEKAVIVKFTSTGGHADVHNSESFVDYVRLRGGHPNIAGLTISLPSSEFVNLFVDHPAVRRINLDKLRAMQESGGVLSVKFDCTLLDTTVSTRLIDAITSFNAARDNLNSVLDLYSISRI